MLTIIKEYAAVSFSIPTCIGDIMPLIFDGCGEVGFGLSEDWEDDSMFKSSKVTATYEWY